MNYRPRWERILLLAAIFNVIAIFFVTSNWFTPEPKVEEEPELQEISWVDVPAAEAATIPPPPEVQTFPEIKFPPIEIPKIELPKLPEPVAVEPVKEIVPAEVKPDESQVKPAETQPKPPENPENKLKAIVKVYPKDLIDQLIASGAVKERTVITSGKIVLAVTIGVDGKVKNAEIRRGGGNDERGTIINFISEVAASSWIFEPYLDDDGNPKEMKTQIEFKPEDF